MYLYLVAISSTYLCCVFDDDTYLHRRLISLVNIFALKMAK